MEAFLSSTFAVAIAEIGDKTQLLSLFLAARFSNRWAIVAGIVVATLANHAASAWLGTVLAGVVPGEWLKWLVALSFIAIGAWLLIPDKEAEADNGVLRYGAFLATTVLFFIAEIGDKTQIATIVLAARYDATLAVIAGTTAGMLAANVPVILAGAWLMERLPLDWTRRAAFVLFVAMGFITLFAW